MWTVENDHHASAIIALDEIDGIPVIIYEGGHYPSAISDDGRSTRDCPHVDVPIWTTVTMQTAIKVVAEGWYAHGLRRHATAWAHEGTESRDQLIAMARAHVPDAIRLLSDVDAMEASLRDEQKRQREWEARAKATRERLEAAIADGLLDRLRAMLPVGCEIECVTVGHGQGFVFWAGQAAWGLGDDPETAAQNLRDLLAAQAGAIGHYAGPDPSRGSTGEPWFREVER